MTVNKLDESYQQNLADWTDVLKTYQEGLDWCASQGKKHYEERHQERGLLLGTLLSMVLRQHAIECISFSMQIRLS
jgi:hypothetical protein